MHSIHVEGKAPTIVNLRYHGELWIHGIGSQMESDRTITELLVKLQRGDRSAAAELMPLMYAELKRLASHYMRNERAGHTLQPTALVHEAYIRLVQQARVNWKGRAHFVGVAAQLMRQILIDHARRHLAAKRGGALQQIELGDDSLYPACSPNQFVALDEALHRLELIDKGQSEIITLRFFGGLTVEETAEVLGIAPRTVKLHWSLARAWLHKEMRQTGAD